MDSVKQSILASHQDESDGDSVFADHYEPIDPSLWNADDAYQLHWSSSVLDRYLVC